MTLSLSIATMAYFSKKFTLWSYDYDTFQPNIGQCAYDLFPFSLSIPKKLPWKLCWKDSTKKMTSVMLTTGLLAEFAMAVVKCQRSFLSILWWNHSKKFHGIAFWILNRKDNREVGDICFEVRIAWKIRKNY